MGNQPTITTKTPSIRHDVVKKLTVWITFAMMLTGIVALGQEYTVTVEFKDIFYTISIAEAEPTITALVMPNKPIDLNDFDSIPGLPGRAGVNDLDYKTVIWAVYEGMRDYIYQGISLPYLEYNTSAGSSNGCTNNIQGSHYCGRERKIYITHEDIQIAYQRFGGDAALAFIVAHEYAHALQHSANLLNKNDQTELQADCLAAYFLGKMRNIFFSEEDIEHIRATAHHIGDFSLRHAGHHGTPKERLSAVEIGFKDSQSQSRNCICFSKYNRR
jgi:hypothetical protein